MFSAIVAAVAAGSAEGALSGWQPPPLGRIALRFRGAQFWVAGRLLGGTVQLGVGTLRCVFRPVSYLCGRTGKVQPSGLAPRSARVRCAPG